MKLREILRFEFLYQVRRPWPWLAFAVLLVFAFVNAKSAMTPVTLPQDFILNSPFVITTISVFSCMIWLLVGSAMAGEAGARDVQTGIYPLLYTAPLSKAEYLGGRFLAAFALNALVLLGVQAGMMLAFFAGGIDPEIIGPFRLEAYLAAYAFIALPNAFVATTVQFAAGLISGRGLAGYFGSVLLVFFVLPVPMIVYLGLGQPALAKLLDPVGMIAIMNEMMTEWTIVEKNVRLFTLQGPMLWNRLLWVILATALLGLIHLRFRFAHRTGAPLWQRLRGRYGDVNGDMGIARDTHDLPIAVPIPPISHNAVTHVRQTLAIARSSFRQLAKSPAGLFLLAAFPLLLVTVVAVESEHWGVPIIPRTGYILAKHLTAPITHATDYRMMIPLLIVFFAGELVWWERDARLHEKVDATSVPEWAVLSGKFLGMGLVLAAYMVALLGVGMVAQVIRGAHDFQLGLYLKILFGLQLPEYLIFAALAIVLQVVVNQKYVALLVTLVAYFLIIFARFLGIDHNLVIYGSGPAWSYTDMRGFGATIPPWLWFKLYWAGWALLLGTIARIFWVRGLESAPGARLRMARLRLTRGTVGSAALAASLILTLGGFIFYNTNVLNEYVTDAEMVRRRAEYERRYGTFEGTPQPERTATNLHIDIHPDRKTARIRGSYRLVNRGPTPIDSLHLEPAFYADTRVKFDRAFRHVLADRKLGHDVYALEQPLRPGDSLTLSFDLRIGRRGFANSGPRSSGAGIGILENGTFLTSGALPLIGYQSMRELQSADDRRKHGLPRQLTLAIPSDIDASVSAYSAATFEAVIGTDTGQVAVAPGELRRTWIEAGRRYFHYVSHVPINGTEVFFSADYAVHRERWKHVDVQVFLHPEHAALRERLLRSLRASLEYYSAEFGPYPYRFLQVVEQPGDFLGMGVDGSGVITGGEGIFLLNPQRDDFDVIFEVAAHEVGHQWWGMQLKPAWAEGGGVISEGLAWYSTMQLVKQERGREALRQLMSFMRQPSPWPPIRTGMPLLRAIDPWANYRKAPYALHALSEYIGEQRVNGALRRLVEKKAASFATTLDMYRELQAVTPDSLKPLLHDLFEVDAFWTFDTGQATAAPAAAGGWQVTFEVEARKVVADSAGRETELPMREWVEIGVFAAAEPGQILGKPLYLQKHRVRSGRQTITVTVADRPGRGGIDPYNLLDWEEGDNIEPIEVN